MERFSADKQYQQKIPELSVMIGNDVCPWCKNPISHEEFLRIKEEIRVEEEAKLDEQRAKLKAEARQAAEAANEEIEQLRVAKQQAEEDRQKALENAKVAHQNELLEQRRVLEEDRDRQIIQQKAEQNRKNEKLESKLKELERQLQEKTANELGEGAEVDLFQTLRDEYPEDKVTRVGKGVKGPDICFEVLDRGKPIGKVVIDSKNHQQWRNSFVDKLREDQRNAKADHAILASVVYPSGHKQLCIKDDVIVANPRYVSMILHLLRESILDLHRLRLSNDERKDKVNQLYDLITSVRFRQLFQVADETAHALSNLDAEEVKAHRKVWEKRGVKIRQLQRALSDINQEIQTTLQGAP